MVIANMRSLVCVSGLNAFWASVLPARIDNQNNPLRKYSYDPNFINKGNTDVEKQGLYAPKPSLK